MDIRFVLPEEVEQLRRNVLTAFPSKTPTSLLQNMESELYQPDEGRYLGCFDQDGILIGSILTMDFTLNVRGVMLPMGAAAYVATNFLHKKEHIARNLLRVMMGYYAKLGTPIGCLHPFNPAFYSKMGYGYANESFMYSPKPCFIRSFGDKSGLSYASPADYEEILDFYHRYAFAVHGATIHPYMDKHRIFDMPYVVICRQKGRITGYLTFAFTEVSHYTDMYHDLVVHEMIYEDTATLKQFMTFFASQIDQIERVRIYSNDEYLPMMFLNPDSGENHAFDGAIQEIGRRCMGYMVRIFDVKQYFMLETHCEHLTERAFTLALDVKDSFIEANNAVFLLHIQDGRVALVENAPADVTLCTNIADLSSLILGSIPLQQFVRCGQMELSDKSYLDDIQNAIGWSKKPQNYTYF